MLRLTDLVKQLGDRYALFGMDDLVLESVLLGAVDRLAGLVNALQRKNRRLRDLAAASQW